LSALGDRRLQPVQKRDRALRARRRLEDGPVVVGEDLDPGFEMARMIGARLQFRRDAEIVAEETAAECGDEFFARARSCLCDSG
jgi:hypothetical protein